MASPAVLIGGRGHKVEHEFTLEEGKKFRKELDLEDVIVRHMELEFKVKVNVTDNTGAAIKEPNPQKFVENIEVEAGDFGQIGEGPLDDFFIRDSVFYRPPERTKEDTAADADALVVRGSFPCSLPNAIEPRLCGLDLRSVGKGGIGPLTISGEAGTITDDIINGTGSFAAAFSVNPVLKVTAIVDTDFSRPPAYMLKHTADDSDTWSADATDHELEIVQEPGKDLASIILMVMADGTNGRTLDAADVDKIRLRRVKQSSTETRFNLDGDIVRSEYHRMTGRETALSDGLFPYDFILAANGEIGGRFRTNAGKALKVLFDPDKPASANGVARLLQQVIAPYPDQRHLSLQR